MYPRKRLKPIGKEKRAAIRERVRLHRERKLIAAEEEAEWLENTEKTLRRLRSAEYTIFGELEAIGENGFPVNASTAEEELTLAKEYQVALGLPPKRPEQTIRNFVLEVLRAWVVAGSKMFNRKTGEFAPEEFEGLDPDKYQFPDDGTVQEQEATQ